MEDGREEAEGGTKREGEEGNVQASVISWQPPTC